MKFTLKAYQRTRARRHAEQLSTRRRRFNRRDATPTSVSLSATTGAGKTVIAAAVIESLFYGNDDYDFEPDHGAVVIWFSDDPNLNEQTRFRLMEASDKVDVDGPRHDRAAVREAEARARQGVLPQHPEADEVVAPHARTRMDDEADVLEGTHASVQPDLQGYTIWETIANTIEDPDLTLYLILDEAHRGFGTKQLETSRRSSSDSSTATPGTRRSRSCGASRATIGDFKEAMDDADVSGDRRYLPAGERRRLPGPGVGPGQGHRRARTSRPRRRRFDMTLVRRGGREAEASSERWETYCDVAGDRRTSSSRCWSCSRRTRRTTTRSVRR